jgi:hypothetical protein
MRPGSGRIFTAESDTRTPNRVEVAADFEPAQLVPGLVNLNECVRMFVLCERDAESLRRTCFAGVFTCWATRATVATAIKQQPKVSHIRIDALRSMKGLIFYSRVFGVPSPRER